jgi:hypothetical protein
MSKYKSGIHIKPGNEGKLREHFGMSPDGEKKIPMADLEKAKNSPDPAVRKRANFAINARGWSHYRK